MAIFLSVIVAAVVLGMVMVAASVPYDIFFGDGEVLINIGMTLVLLAVIAGICVGGVALIVFLLAGVV